MEITIDGIRCNAEDYEYVLAVAARNGIEIPSLCHHDALPGQACCRLCLVEAIESGRSKVVVSCVFPVSDGLEIRTNTEKIRRLRKNVLTMLAEKAPAASGLEKLCAEYGVTPDSRFVTDPGEKCILCGLCAKACKLLGNAAITTASRGTTKNVTTAFDAPSPECIGCGTCSRVCPVGAIDLKETVDERVIWNRTFKLVKCECCGEPVGTQEQVKRLRETGALVEDGGTLCLSCKKKQAVSAM